MRTRTGLLLSSLAVCSLAQAAQPGVPDAGAKNHDTVAKTDASENTESRAKPPLPRPDPKDRVHNTFPPAAKK
jgi:hypothetical protein